MTQEKNILYKKALVELYVIITYMKQDLQNKIPEELKLSIIKNKDEKYKFKYDITLPLYKQELLLETKSLLSVIYTNYLCSDEEKEKWNEYDKFYIQKQEQLKSKNYVEKDLFENREIENELSLVVVENKKNSKLKEFFKKIFSKISK